MTSYIFGIEKNLFDSLSSAEKRKFNSLSVLFVLLISVSCISGIYLSNLIFPNVVISLITGLMIGFIVFNMLRFSLSSIERPLDYDSTQNSSKGFFKFLIFSILATFLALPFSSLLLTSLNKDKIELNRKQKLDEYVQYLSYSKERSIDYYNKKIEKLNNLISNEKNIALNTSRLNSIVSQRSLLLKKIEKDNERKIIGFKKVIKNAKFPLFQFKISASHPVGFLIIFAINYLFYRILKKTYVLVYSSDCYYSDIVSTYHRKIIDQELELNSIRIKNILKDKYNYYDENIF